MENRKEARLDKAVRVVLKDESGNYPAQVTSISRSGMSVKVEHVFPVYKVVDVLVKIENRVIDIKGSVRWVNDIPPINDNQPHHEVGIMLQNPPNEYLIHFK